MKLKPEFVDGEPRCPACGSPKFDTTFELSGAGEWRLEKLHCYDCGTELEVTDELDKFVRGEKWTVKVATAAPKAKAQATNPVSAPAAEEKSPDEAIEGESFSIDPTRLSESQKTLKWTDDTCKTFLVSKYKVSPQGTLEDVIKRLTREQAEDFVDDVNSRLEKQPGLFE